MTNEFLTAIGADRILSNLESMLSEAEALIPEELGIPTAAVFSLAFACAVLGIGVLFRVFFGKESMVNQSISTSVGILFIYAVTVIIYTLDPWRLAQYLSPLPFALFRKDILLFIPFWGTDTTLLCSQILSLVILCFIVHLLNQLIPKGKGFISWFLLRCISVGFAIFLNLTANWILNSLFPVGFAAYAPTVLLVILGVALLVGLFNPLLCIIFSIVNPIFGLLYTFFFSNLIGKQVTKAVFSTALVCVLFMIMEYWGYTVINITESAILSYLPFGAVFLITWYIFDRKL